jgi:hypothetical protein
MSPRRARAAGQVAGKATGQAMAEFAVALGVLALLLAGLPALQRYHQLQFAAVGAARESAWLASWRSAAAPAARPTLDLAQLQARWLPEGKGDSAGQAPGESGVQPVASDARLAVSRAGLPGAAGSAAQALLLPLQPLTALGIGGASASGLRADGLIHANASLEVATPGTLPEPFGGLRLTLQEQYALAADGWGAAGPAQVASRVQALVPSSLVARVPGLVEVGTTLLSLLEPQFRHFCPGYVNPEIVPADRLVRGSDGLPVTSWRSPC